MPDLRILIANPGAQIVEGPDITWILAGVGADDVEDLKNKGHATDGLEPEICRKIGDANIVKIHAPNGSPATLTAWRGISSCHETFYCTRPTGEIFVSDHFRDILALLPIEDRTPSDEAIVDHFLFKSAPGENTYARGVKRVGKGSKLVLDIATAQDSCAIFDRIEDISEPGSTSQYIERLDHALMLTLRQLNDDKGIANFVTGGIDSTLVQSYLGSDVTALNLVPARIDSGWEFQLAYAPRAADLLGVELRQLRVMGGDFLDQLESNVMCLGMPQRDFNFGMYPEAMELDYRTYVISEGADELFGSGTRLARLAWLLRIPLQLLPNDIGAAAGSQGLGKRLSQLKAVEPSLREDPRSPRGLGAMVNCLGFTDFDVVASVFGSEIMYDRLAERVDYAVKRVALVPPDASRFVRHLEISQWVRYLCKDDIMLMRHMAHARGKLLLSPFLFAPVLSAAQSVPPHHRYIRGLQPKQVEKQLLKKRVPQYPVNQRKGRTGVDFSYYYPDGPLADVWERYDVPDFFQNAARKDQSLTSNGKRWSRAWDGVVWHAISFAAWEKTVRRDSTLQPGANTRILSSRILT